MSFDVVLGVPFVEKMFLDIISCCLQSKRFILLSFFGGVVDSKKNEQVNERKTDIDKKQLNVRIAIQKSCATPQQMAVI